jgi:hypothetical protein
MAGGGIFSPLASAFAPSFTPMPRTAGTGAARSRQNSAAADVRSSTTTAATASAPPRGLTASSPLPVDVKLPAVPTLKEPTNTLGKPVLSPLPSSGSSDSPNHVDGVHRRNPPSSGGGKRRRERENSIYDATFGHADNVFSALAKGKRRDVYCHSVTYGCLKCSCCNNCNRCCGRQRRSAICMP